jgi:hypothetical protein
MRSYVKCMPLDMVYIYIHIHICMHVYIRMNIQKLLHRHPSTGTSLPTTLLTVYI